MKKSKFFKALAIALAILMAIPNFSSVAEAASLATITVNHWYQKTDGDPSKQDADNYTLEETEFYTYPVGEMVYVDPIRKAGYKSPESMEFMAAGDETYNLYYTIRTYEVKIVAGNGIVSVTGDGNYTYGADLTLSATSKRGYSTPTWTQDGTGNEWVTETVNTTVTGNMTFRVNSTIEEYTIELDYDGGTPSWEPYTYYTVESFDINLPYLYREGYVFLGWTGSNGDIPEESVTIPAGSTGDRTYKANWITWEEDQALRRTYTVRHWLQNWDGDSEIHDTNNYTLMESGTWEGRKGTIFSPYVNEYTGYISPEPKSVTFGDDDNQYVDYYYVRNDFSDELYTVTISSNNVENLQGAGTYHVGDVVKLGADTPVGYQGVAWETPDGEIFYRPFIMPAHDLTLHAYGCDPLVYYIYYTLNGGTLSSENPPFYMISTETFTLNNPTKDGYIFLGWTGRNGNLPQLEVTISKGSIGGGTFTANWLPENADYTTYTVNHWGLKLNGDPDKKNAENYELLNSMTMSDAIGNIVSIPIMNSDPEVYENPETAIKTVTENMVHDYYYTRKNFEINVNTGRGIASVSGDGIYMAGSGAELVAVVKNGYDTPIWSKNDELIDISEIMNVTVYANHEFTVYAEPIAYSITYELDGGNEYTNPITYTVATDTFTLTNPTKDGCTFLGWTGSNGNTPEKTVTVESGSMGALSFTANWIKSDTSNIVVNGEPVEGNLIEVYEPVSIENMIEDEAMEPLAKLITGEEQFCQVIEVSLYLEGENNETLELKDNFGQYPITFYVGEAYAGKVALIHHLHTDGTVSSDEKVVQTDGTVTIVVTDLSPFMITVVESYTIHFEGNGATGTMEDIAVICGKEVTLPKNGFIRDGYLFKGWAMATNGTSVYGDGISANFSTEDDQILTMYAVWEKKQAPSSSSQGTSNPGNTGTESSNPSSPSIGNGAPTGDAANIMLPISAMISCLLVILLIVKRKRQYV